MNPFAQLGDIFHRASTNQPLTPAERATLKLLVHGALYQVLTALVAALAGAQALLTNASFSWPLVVGTAVVTFFCALLSSGAKFVTAQGDAPLGDALGVISNLAQQFSKGGSAAFLASLHQTDRSNLVLKLMQGVMQLNVVGPTTPAPAPVPAVALSAGAPLPLLMEQPVPLPAEQRLASHVH